MFYSITVVTRKDKQTINSRSTRWNENKWNV